MAFFLTPSGSQVEAKLAVPRDPDQGSKGGYVEPSQRVVKIFVGGLPAGVTDGELKEYFDAFGTVQESQVFPSRNPADAGQGGAFACSPIESREIGATH